MSRTSSAVHKVVINYPLSPISMAQIRFRMLITRRPIASMPFSSWPHVSRRRPRHRSCRLEQDGRHVPRLAAGYKATEHVIRESHTRSTISATRKADDARRRPRPWRLCSNQALRRWTSERKGTSRTSCQSSPQSACSADDHVPPASGQLRHPKPRKRVSDSEECVMPFGS